MELQQCINYLLTTAQHNVFQVMRTKLSAFDITPVQYGVLNCLWGGELSRPNEIAECLHLENSTISGVLERMERKELIERTISREDRRYVTISLTEKGSALEMPVMEAVDDVNQIVMACIPEDKQDLLKTSLRRIIETQFG